MHLFEPEANAACLPCGPLNTPPAAAPTAQVQLRGLSLLELGQGPGAAAARDLRDPGVWTHLVWAINRFALVFGRPIN